MLPYRLPRPIRLAAYALASAILLYICLAPSDELPKVNLWDKEEHALAWFVLTATGLILSPRRPRAIALYAFSFGVFIEVVQGLMGFGRDADWHDVAADSIGIVAAFIPYFAILLLAPRSQGPRRAPNRAPTTPRHRPWEEAAEFTIGLKPIPLDAWLEGGEADPAARKDRLFAARRGLVWAEAEGSRAGQAEVASLVDAALGSASAPADLPPLFAAARRVPDDLCLMEKRDGQWRLTALSLSAGSFFTAEQVIGKSLAELHGPVTGFAERLLVRVHRIFEGLRPELVLERRNWTVLNSADLHTPSSAPIRARIGEIDPADAGRALSLRVERQTLRRLPRTGGALFTIRVWVAPLESLRGDPERLAAFAEAWRGAHPDLRAYKRFDLYDDLVEAFLRSA